MVVNNGALMAERFGATDVPPGTLVEFSAQTVQYADGSRDIQMREGQVVGFDNVGSQVLFMVQRYKDNQLIGQPKNIAAEVLARGVETVSIISEDTPEDPTSEARGLFSFLGNKLCAPLLTL